MPVSTWIIDFPYEPSFSPEPTATAWLLTVWRPASSRQPSKRHRRWFRVKRNVTYQWQEVMGQVANLPGQEGDGGGVRQRISP
jgi:hypothetical protein